MPSPSTPPMNDIGLIGLAVMGQNLALNIADHGFAIAVYNRTTSKMTEFVGEHPAGSFGKLGGSLAGYAELREFVASLKRPRRVVIMVQAGAGTDAVIGQLADEMDAGDLIVDGGNAHWEDTQRREQTLRARGIHFIGSGVSGGELGARFGPSLMPGGDLEAWNLLEPVWKAIAAKVDAETGRPIETASAGEPVTGGEPCTGYVGPDGAGHFVKMVHNGIEYADMQLICEAFHLLRGVAGLEPARCAEVFTAWNGGELDSYLIEITADILAEKDARTGKPFVDVVLDKAGQKGTGRWTSEAALKFGAPAMTIAEAVFARGMSALKDERVRASGVLRGPGHEEARRAMTARFGAEERFVEAVEHALYCSKICAYAQGFQIMAAASAEYGWGVDFAGLAAMWRGGCIIRARFLQRITQAYRRDKSLVNLLLDPFFGEAIAKGQGAWREVVASAAVGGVPMPAMMSALAYYDSYRHAVLPAKLLQAQRDYFGAHTYERVDEARGKFFHLDWPVSPRVESPA